MSPHHYGSSKAAVYLSDLLRDQTAVRRRVDKILQGYQKNLSDTIWSDLPGPLKVWTMTALMKDASQKLNAFTPPINTVAQNFVKGRFKEGLLTLAHRNEKTKHGVSYAKFFKKRVDAQ